MEINLETVMTGLIVDDEQRQAILDSNGMVEVSDASGKVLGHLWCLVQEDEMSPEEIHQIKEAAKNSKRWYTTQEVLERLEQLAPSDPNR